MDAVDVDCELNRTGALASNVQDKLDQIINVHDFGTGNTDIEFQKAIDAAIQYNQIPPVISGSQKKKILWVPAGKYEFDVPVQLKSNLKIIAEQGVIITTSSSHPAGKGIFELDDQNNISVEGIHFSSEVGDAKVCFYCVSSNTTRQTNISIINCSSENTAGLVNFTGKDAPKENGFTSGYHINDVLIQGCSALNSVTPAFELVHCTNVRLIGNRAENCFKDEDNRRCAFRIAASMSLNLDKNSVYNQGETTGLAANNTIHAYSFDGANGCSHVTFTNNLAYQTGGNGINMEPGCKNVVISNNEFLYGRNGEGITLHGKDSQDATKNISNVIISDNIITNRGRTPNSTSDNGDVYKYYEDNGGTIEVGTDASQMSGIIVENGKDVQIISNQIDYCYNGINVTLGSENVDVSHNAINNSSGPAVLMDRSSNSFLRSNRIKNAGLLYNTGLTNFRAFDRSVIVVGIDNVEGADSLSISENSFVQDSDGKANSYVYNGSPSVKPIVWFYNNRFEVVTRSSFTTIEPGNCNIGEDIILNNGFESTQYSKVFKAGVSGDIAKLGLNQYSGASVKVKAMIRDSNGETQYLERVYLLRRDAQYQSGVITGSSHTILQTPLSVTAIVDCNLDTGNNIATFKVTGNDGETSVNLEFLNIRANELEFY